ncbi:phytanoyl-CoA dioxygenase family protein [Streptomyces sp. CAU 1734]|uniref:phytanoyl-CoA dioxygenase family protein n=1 Tax=Streptomyces sp. CAU 1734 TaxID=3140360 RepID=UPI003260D11D
MSEHTAMTCGSGDIDRFRGQGYLVLPGFLPPDLVARLKPEVDHWVDTGLRRRSIDACLAPDTDGPPPLVELQLPAHGELAAHPPLLRLLAGLLGPSFVFHHLHSDRRPPDGPGKSWHHDYEQYPQLDRVHAMAHALHYIGGLEPGMGGLAILPGSHRDIADKTALAHFGTAELPGEVLLDRLPPGSTVLLHSALFHARRAAPASGEGVPRASGPRYMIDGSYCQTGRKWPPVKPYWRHLLAAGRARRLDRGEWPDLFREAHFTEYRHRAVQPAAPPGGPSRAAGAGPRRPPTAPADRDTERQPHP